MADQGAEGLLSPWLRERRFRAALPYIRGRVLDIGCGTGRLAQHIPPDRYAGIDQDHRVLQQARSRFPTHTFTSSLPGPEERFDTVAALAVIEHVDDPTTFLRTLSAHLGDSPGARIIITTPHPAMGWVHKVGSAMGLFSRNASKEHKGMLDRLKLADAGGDAGLRLVMHRRFLLGANQIAVFEKVHC